MKTDNNTLNGIKNDAERSLLILWSLTVLLSSLIGDSIILIATIKYKAIILHKVIITVMQHMAVCDLIQTVFRVFPEHVALITDVWMMGELLCHVSYNISWVCNPVAVFMTSALTTLKLIVVKYPLRTGAWSTWLGHKVCSSVWLLVLGFYIPLLVGNLLYIRDTIYFSYEEYTCDYDHLSPSLPAWFTWYFPISVAVLSVLSFTILIVTSVLLLIVASRAASRHGETLRWEGVITILLTAGVLLISYLPKSVIIVTLQLGVEYSNTTSRVSYHLTSLNIMANFFVYSLTVQSFRNFLKVKLSEFLSLIRLSTQRRPQPHHRRQTNQRPQTLQKRRPNPRQRPNSKGDAAEVHSDTITLPPAAELQGMQRQKGEIKHYSTNIVDMSV